MTLQKKATIISSLVAGFLTILKFSIGLASGSVAVLASAVDSILDMFVSIFNFFAITKSEQPADENFNYGRGKIEALASVIEGTIIAISGLFLLYTAIVKYNSGSQSTMLDVSLIVMIASLIITLCLVAFLNYVAKKTNSMVIKADALHYKSDVYSNGAVLVSLFLVWFLELEIIDIIVGSVIAIYIVYSSYELIKDGILVLLDRSLEKEMVDQIIEILNNEQELNSWHYLKTRQAGNDIFIEVHLVFNCLISLMEAHRIGDRIEIKMMALDKTKNIIVNIHLDPYDDSQINSETLGCNVSYNLHKEGY